MLYCLCYTPRFHDSIIFVQYGDLCFTSKFLNYTALLFPTTCILNCKLHGCRAAVDLKSAMLWCCGLTQTSASASVQSSQSSCPPHPVVPRHTGAKLFLYSGTACCQLHLPVVLWCLHTPSLHVGKRLAHVGTGTGRCVKVVLIMQEANTVWAWYSRSKGQSGCQPEGSLQHGSQ